MFDRYQEIINNLNEGEFDFDSIVARIFSFQKVYNPVYAQFCSLLDEANDQKHDTIFPFCPIAVFKHRQIIAGHWTPNAQYFMSSGTGGQRSRHDVRDLAFYHHIAQRIFELHFGEIREYQVLSLLPHYSDNPHSSLLSMMDSFERISRYPGRSFLTDYQGLSDQLEENRHKAIPTVLFGVSFALLDYIDHYQHILNDQFLIIETGGMKKFKKEMTKAEILGALRSSFRGATICSEYGMTECLSQAYSVDSAWLRMNPYFRVVITDPLDPRAIVTHGRIGRINIIDLANVDTLSFIATDDMGRISSHDPQLFEVLGRLSNTDLRGCNYLI